ncbi:MAG: PIN domain-containing protein [Acidobacteriota bacterium]
MNVFVDTSVWSLALRRDAPPHLPEVRLLDELLERRDPIFTTGIVLQELLQGFHRGPRAAERIIERFTAFHRVTPETGDHIESARLYTRCRQHGVQVGTIDALLAQLCIRYELAMLSTDRDFYHIARWTGLKLLEG